MITNLLVDSSIKMSAVVLAALAATALLRRRSAALRHWILTAALVSAAAMPALARLTPSWTVRAGGVAQVYGRLVAGTVRAEPNEPATHMPPVPHARSGVSPDARANMLRVLDAAVPAVWAAGASLCLFVLFAGVCRVASISRQALPVDGGEWRTLTGSAASALGLRRTVRVLRTDRRGLIFTWGVVRPTVIVPSGAERWSPDRVRVVLAHELAHAKRGDWLIQIVCDTIRALCWFNPIIWIACRRLRHESERAADDAVINGGVDGVAYAAELVDLARTFAVLGRPWLPAPAILRASNFERRISSMLSAHLNRRPVSRLTRTITVAAVSAVAVAIASAQGVFSSFSGTVYDPLRGLLPGVRLVLTSAQTNAKYEIRSDRDGRFEFVGLPPGRYALETELPGFRALKGSVEIAGQDIQRELTLAVGSLQETVAVGPSDVEMRREGGRPRVTTSWTTTCTPDRQPGGIGGNLRAPTKLVHVLPRFPANLAAAGASGVVVLDATIGADGTIQEVRTRSSPHPDFEAAAIDAVREWEFSQTLLNCVPVEVAMTVTINFAAR